MTSVNLPAIRRSRDVAVRTPVQPVPVLRLGSVARTALAATVVVVPFAGLAITLIGQAS